MPIQPAARTNISLISRTSLNQATTRPITGQNYQNNLHLQGQVKLSQFKHYSNRSQFFIDHIRDVPRLTNFSRKVFIGGLPPDISESKLLI